MVTKICTLTFPDGQAVTATVTATTPTVRTSVGYVGALTRLPEPLKKVATPAILEAHFSNLAEDLGATFTTTQTGQFETWAE